MAPNSAGEPDLDIPDSPLSDPVHWVPNVPEAPPPLPKPGTLTATEKRIAVASVAAGAVVTLLVLTQTAASSVPTPGTAPAPAPVRAAALSPVATGASPTWSDQNRDNWVSRSRGSFAYEVLADKSVSVWMRTVRPSLVVRCDANVLDVFVFTDSAAKIESDTLDHTISMRIDDGEQTSTRWPDADTHDALFAPGGPAFAHRLAAATTLQFGFTPHNGEPVTMKFAVAGLAPLLARAAKEGCK